MKQAITGAKIFSDHKLLDNKALLIDDENIIGIVAKNDIFKKGTFKIPEINLATKSISSSLKISKPLDL